MENSAQFVTIQGAPLCYETRGDGEPLLLIHAGITDRRMWDPQWESLSADFRLIRYDLRGFGLSAPPDGPFTHYDDVRGLLDHLKIDRARIAGVSFGGRIALDFALAYPDRVQSLILGAPGVGGYSEWRDTAAFDAQEEALLAAGDIDAAAQLNVDFWVVGPKREPEQVDPAVRQAVFEMQRAAFAIKTPPGFAPSGLTPPAIDRLHEIDAPVLVLAGEADVSDFVRLARRVSSEIEGAILVVRPNVGHMVTMERPREADDIIRSFIAPQ